MLKEAPFLTSDMHGNFVDLKKKTKTFNEGPLPPASPSQNQNGFLGTFKSPDLVNVKKPPLVPRRETFTPGYVCTIFMALFSPQKNLMIYNLYLKILQ